MEQAARPKISRKLLALIVVGLIVVIAGVIYYCVPMANRDPFPSVVRNETSFPLYYPRPLPAHWMFISTSFYLSQGIVGYRVEGPSGSINMTIQTVPQDFDFTSFYAKKLTNVSLITTPLGEGAIGKADGSFLVGSLVIGNVWILATPSAATVLQPDIQFVLNHLKKS